MLPSFSLLFLMSLFSSPPLVLQSSVILPYSIITVQSSPAPSVTVEKSVAKPERGNGGELPSYRIPYRLTDTRHLLVRAKLNGKGPFNFIIDTGAPAVFVAKDTASKAGVAARADGWATVANLEIEGGAVVRQISARLDDPTQLTGMNSLGLAGVHIDGILGYNLLARFRMEIDLTQSHMVWTPVKALLAKIASLEQLTGGKPFTPTKGMTQMDSMAKLAATMIKKLHSETTVRGFLGIEFAPENPHPAAPIIIGSENGAKSDANTSLQPAITRAADTANDTKQRDKKGVMILHVMAGSPAAIAGVQPGDVLQGLALGSADLESVATGSEVLSKTQTMEAGSTVRLQLLRGEKKIEITVKAAKGGL